MARQHAYAHLARRQRNRNEDEDTGAVATVTSIAIVTLSNPYTGKVVWITQSEAPKTLIEPATRARLTSVTSVNRFTSTTIVTTTTRPATTSKTASSAENSDTEETLTTKAASTLVMATKSPTPDSISSIVGLASATASATVSATSTAEASSDGMSGGAKAGLALGVLFGFAALLVGILFLYGRKKKQMAKARDNEKTNMQATLPLPPPPPPPPQFGAAPGPRNQRTLSAAPRLSLRPLTNFAPTWSDNRQSEANLLAAATATAPAARSQDRSTELERPTSSWERPGATGAIATPSNPFSDAAAHPNNPTSNPFGNSAAVDAGQAYIPDSPPSNSPLHSKVPSADFANPAPAIAAANTNAVDVTSASALPVSLPTNGFPSPPSFKTVADMPLPSPAWTEDAPASPGSAIVPAVVAMAGGHPNGPLPGANNVHRVQQSFKPSMADELGLRAGSLVRMLHEYDDGWALCINMDRSQQGVVPRTCLSKYPVKPRTGPPRQGPPQGPPPGMRGPAIRLPMAPNGSPSPQSPSSANSHMLPTPRSMSPGPNQMPPPRMQGAPRNRSNSNAPFNSPPGSMSPYMQGPPRRRSNSSAPFAGPPRSMSPGPHGGGPEMAPPPHMSRPRSNSASQVGARRPPVSGPSPMNPNAMTAAVPRKPVPGMAL